MSTTDLASASQGYWNWGESTRDNRRREAVCCAELLHWPLLDNNLSTYIAGNAWCMFKSSHREDICGGFSKRTTSQRGKQRKKLCIGFPLVSCFPLVHVQLQRSSFFWSFRLQHRCPCIFSRSQIPCSTVVLGRRGAGWHMWLRKNGESRGGTLRRQRRFVFNISMKEC